MKVSTVLWVIVPGVGQIHLGRAGKGILFFTLFALLLNGCVLSPLLVSDKIVRMTLLALTTLLWLIAAVDFIRDSAAVEAETAHMRRNPQ